MNLGITTGQIARVLGAHRQRESRAEKTRDVEADDDPAMKSTGAEAAFMGRPIDSVPVEAPIYAEARRHIQRHAWGHAQRALEQAALEGVTQPVDFDLASVRVVRRALRRASRRPSDVDAHLDLGRAYFDLDLADEALSEFTTAQRLAPNRHEGFVLAAMEYLYRGQYATALTFWMRAQDVNPELPQIDEVMKTLPQK
jgi:cytochrome c-type biogenesis protein CcmH/NrfG